mmetsp:Transcript_2651/g.2998  ORF Transcript_2651/g.2998 Transcript_2651/m.2998 type:complete len:163 (-) Transcript_2651:227-715(-)
MNYLRKRIKVEEDINDVPAEESTAEEDWLLKREPVELTPKQERVRDVAMLVFNIHASVAFSIVSMLMAINVLVMISTKNKSLWSLFILFAWGGMLGIHFGVTYSVFVANHIPTDDLKDFLLAVRTGVELYVAPIVKKIQDGGNPFPRRSKAAKIYNYFMRPN